MSSFNPHSLASADTSNPDLLNKLVAEVDARNRLNKAANRAAVQLREYFDGLVGKKIIKADGCLMKAIRHEAEMVMLFADDSVQHWFEPSSYCLFVCFKATYEGPRHVSYLECRVLVACTDKGFVVPFTGNKEPRREDYTATEIVSRAKRMVELSKEIDLIGRGLYEFKRFDWNG